MENDKFVAQTQYGLEEVLVQELKELGATNVEPLVRAVSFEASQETLYRINLCSRLALRVLKPLTKFIARTTDELHLRAKAIKWEEIMTLKDTFKVDAIVSGDIFTHSQYAGLRLKDGICDHFRAISGKRPDVDVNEPNFTFALHIRIDEVTVYIDSTGESLHKRKYRADGNIAPLNEILASGILALSDWDPSTPMVDGMTGSATLVIEALYRATDTPPAFKRREFAFMNWPDFNRATWLKVKRAAEENIKDIYPNIIGIDKDGAAVNAARENIVRAGFKPIHHLEQNDFFKYVPKEKEGTLLLNPPYDVRLKEGDINQLYQDIGDYLKHNYQGWTVWMISANEEARKHVGLRTTRKIKLYNGKLECKLCRYEMY